MATIQLIGHLLISAGFFAWCATFVAGRVKRPTLRAILSWPLYGIALLLFAGAVVTILWNTVGPLVSWIVGLFR